MDDIDRSDPAPPSAASPVADPPAAGRRRTWRTFLFRSSVALMVLAGAAVVAGVVYYDNVALPEDLDLKQATTIFYADGSTPIARIGDKNRTVLVINDIPADVQHAVVAAQDESFYTNDGVDYGGVWGQLTGDGQRGATISQQYAHQRAQLDGAPAARKLRETAIALKLNDSYDKPKILEMYLNITYFGRGAYGIQAAAQAYFGKPAKDLTLAEGMVLAGLIDDPTGPDGKGSPYDPTVDDKRAHERFEEIRRALLRLKFVSPDEAGQRTAYPSKVLTAAQTRAAGTVAQAGLDRAEGFVVHHVLEEVAALTDAQTGAPLYAEPGPAGRAVYDRIRNGGLKIVTTVDRDVQRIAVREASRNAESEMAGQPGNLQAALVAVEPGTGAVKAYYGGDDGTRMDYAGSYRDPVLGDGEDSCCGAHPPGATFGAYLLAAGLMAGYRTDSRWNGESPQPFPENGRTGAQAVRNFGENPVSSPPCRKWCTLEEATVTSLNVVSYALTLAVGPARIIDTARAAGITEMWAVGDGGPQKVDLTRNQGKDVFPMRFGTEVGIGQYPVTVLEQAGGYATFAARGLTARTHFLKEIWSGGRNTYREVVVPVRVPGFTEGMADDLNAVLQGVPKRAGLQLHDGRPVAGMTGSWQLGNTGHPADAWMAGYSAYDPAGGSPGLSVAVWVGNKGVEQPLLDSGGADILGGGLPGRIWRDFLDDALTAAAAPKVPFRPRQGGGDKTVGTGVPPRP